MNKPLSGKKPLIGIIGGMGAQATACFYTKLHNLQNVAAEQDFLDVLLYSIPSVPDRTAFITGKSNENPLDSLIKAACFLESAGVSCIAIPCITSHYFYDELARAVDVPIINLLEETASAARGRNIKSVYLLATSGTIKGKVFNSAFEKQGINVIFPPDNIQSDLMDLIYDIKCGVPFPNDTLDAITERAQNDGAEAVVLGCTELCLSDNGNTRVINTLDVLAEATLKTAALLSF